MQFLSKHFIVLLFLLVLIGLAAHVFMDIQHADNGFQTNWGACWLHATILLCAINMVMAAPIITNMPQQIASSRSVPVLLPFRPPIF